MVEQAFKITTGGAERLARATEITSVAYASNPSINYLLQTVPVSSRANYLPKYIGALIKAGALNKALFIEADDWKHVSVIMPPGTKPGNPWTILPAGFVGVLWNVGVVGCYRMLLEYEPLALACQKGALKSYLDNYYYIYFTSTIPEAGSRGLCTFVTQNLQQKAEEEKVPIWLEATTEQAREYYARLGWEMCGDIVLGKGKVDATGDLKKDGEGVTIWGMVWWPNCLKESVK